VSRAVERIPVAGPWITDLEAVYVEDAARNAWYAGANAWHARFEKAMAAHCGRKHAMALPSCTSALHLALAGLGVTRGDEVVVTDVTWIATAAPIDYVGATAVFADIERASWCLSPASLEACLTPRTKAVIVVDLYGSMPDLDGLQAVCDRHRVPLIEDAAEAIGSTYRGRPAGSFGIASTFSFHGSKTITTGEGGMLLTDDDDLLARCAFLRDHGRLPGDRMFFNAEVAFKYKMSSLQAALGTAQVERMAEIVDKKSALFRWYKERLGGLPGITLNPELPGVVSQCWMITALVDPARGIGKAALMDALSAKGIDTRPFFHPLSSLPAYAGRPQAAGARARNVNAYAISPWGINLPSALALTEAQVDYVCEAFREALAATAAS
jgi:perosamine synthetase